MGQCEANPLGVRHSGIQLPMPDTEAIVFDDVRPAKRGHRLGLIGFYYDGQDQPWDSMCKAGFCGNLFDLGQNGLCLEAKRFPGAVKQFRNAEAAFQALKFWNLAHEFSDLSGHDAFKKKRELAGQEDFTYGGFGSNWKGMLAVLEAKFKRGSRVADALLATDDTFLLEHNSVSGRDKIWSDNCDGEGTNWLGLQIMFFRDKLSGRAEWTRYLGELINLDSGSPHNAACQQRWQSAVRGATQAVVAAVGKVCARPGCGKPSWNGRPNEYCSRTCRDRR